MKKQYIIGIISMILGFILLIPSFIFDFMETILLLTTLLGITFIMLTFYVILFIPREKNNNQNSN